MFHLMIGSFGGIFLIGDFLVVFFGVIDFWHFLVHLRLIFNHLGVGCHRIAMMKR